MEALLEAIDNIQQQVRDADYMRIMEAMRVVHNIQQREPVIAQQEPNAIITEQAVIEYLISVGQRGALSKEIAKRFHTTKTLINRKFSAEHVSFDQTWRGIYNIPNIRTEDFRHFYVPPVAVQVPDEPVAVDVAPRRINLIVRPRQQ